MSSSRLLLSSCFLIAACAPAAVVPSSPDHPANPDAPTGSAPPAARAADEHGGEHDHHHEHGAAPADPAAAELAAYQAARPVLEAYCADCHQRGGAHAKASTLEHFDMTEYPFGGHHAATIGAEIREVLGVDGGKPTMPKGNPGAVKGDELALVVAWVDAWQAAHPAPAEHHHDHH